MSDILVTGGAGYIGSHVVRMLAERGYTPVVYDNLSNGNRDSVRGHDFVLGDIGDYEALRTLFRERDIRGVMNFASFIAVGESVAKPLTYYENNVARTITLFRAMLDAEVFAFIFSSSAAVYGYPRSVPIVEESALAPINPYGRTKLMIEQVLRDLDEATRLRSVCLRYFNAAGAHPSGEIGENHVPETHLIPLVMRSVLDPSYRLTVFGTDYNTPDGTCVRDYIHVDDLAEAHVLALVQLLASGSSRVYNLGNGTGFSVREIVESVRRVTGKVPKITEGERRPGDPDALVASSALAQSELGWTVRYRGIDEIVETAWRWESGGKRKGY